MDLHQARINMIEQQVRPWDVLDQRVLDVLDEIPRDQFVSEQHRGLAYSDYPLPIGHDQHMLKPTIEGRLLQSLLLEVTDRVLEIGTGTGYLTACLARLCAHVQSIEVVEALAESAKNRLAAMAVSNVTVTHQDASQPWDAADRYDAIAFSGALPSIPDFYQQRMCVGGRMFAVIGDSDRPTMEAVLLTRVKESEWSQESLFECVADPLINFESAKPSFVF